MAEAADRVAALRRRTIAGDGTGQPVRAVTTAVELAARDTGVAVEELAEHPESPRVVARATGRPDRIVRWLARIDGMVLGGTSLVRELSLVAVPGNTVEVEVILEAPTNIGSAGRARDGGERDHEPAGPLDGRHALAAALSRPAPQRPSATAAAERTPRHAGGAGRSDDPGPASGGPVVLGTIEVDGAVRHAVRVEPAGVVVLVRPGDSAFGWSVVGSEAGRLVFEREEVRHETYR